MNHRFRLVVFVLCAVVTASSARAAERVDFVIGPDAPPLEADAANESAAQFQKLFGVETSVSKQVPGDGAQIVLIGSPATNPAVKDALGDNWPKTSDQGIVIRSFERSGKPALVLGGGSPTATFWAVCEFGYRNGVRYLLREDIFPGEVKPLKLEGYEILMEPALRTRAWRTINDFATGSEGWSAADQKKLFRQLAKMKFNRITFAVYPWQPFVDYEFQGVKKKTAQLWYGEKFRVDGDTPGKIAFGGAQYFENPDFAGKNTYEEMTAAGVQYVRTLIDAAHELGMSAELSILPLEFPPEFDPVLPQVDRRMAISTPATPENEQLVDLVRTIVRAHVATYPHVDAISLEIDPLLSWNFPKDIAVKKRADSSSAKSAVPYEESALLFLSTVLKDDSLLERVDGGRIGVSIGQTVPEILAKHASSFPLGTAVLAPLYKQPSVPAGNLPCRQLVPLTSFSAGVLPQSSLKKIEALLGALIETKWHGFVVQHGAPGELDPAVHYLSRASFDPKIKSRQAFDDLFVTITGKPAASDRLWKVFEHLEQATGLIDTNNLGFAFPRKEMSLGHDVAEPVPSWWKDVIAHYTESSNELYRSHDAADPRSRKLLFYYAKRSEYVLEYLTAVGAVRAAALAKKEGKADEATKQLETAVEQMYNALDTLSDIARDQSDRGLIAVLTEYAYRPLVKKLEEADAEQK